MKATLPKDAKNPGKRREQLERFRELYQFDYEFLGGIPFLDRIPKREKFSIGYWVARMSTMATMPLNLVLARIRTWIRPLRKPQDFSRMFIVEEESEMQKTWTTDDTFNDQRNLGCNPQRITLMDRLPEGMPITDDVLQEVLGEGHTVAGEIEAKRLWLADYEELAHITEGGVWKGRRKYVPAPRAVYAWEAGSRRMRCIGIQVGREPGSRLFKPSDPANEWLAAKIAVQCAEANHQELGSHFAGTHTVMIPFAVCTRRQLAQEHPIHIMLEPHLKYYLYDNELGRTSFLNPDGPVERMMGGTLAESVGIAAQVYGKWSFFESAHPKELARRGVDDPDVLPDYPFRDDGLLVWEALGRYTAAYLGLYYRTDQAVRDDHELQAWAEELTADNGGRVPGMVPKIETVEELAEILQIVIWTMAPLHSMLNFSQWDYISAPNMPYALYAPFPEEGPVTTEMLMELLPPYKQAAYQLMWNKALTSYRYDSLGNYRDEFEDAAAQSVLKDFQRELAEIEKEIEAREASRRVSSPYFKPSRCTNSINT